MKKIQKNLISILQEHVNTKFSHPSCMYIRQNIFHKGSFINGNSPQREAINLSNYVRILLHLDTTKQLCGILFEPNQSTTHVAQSSSYCEKASKQEKTLISVLISDTQCVNILKQQSNSGPDVLEFFLHEILRLINLPYRIAIAEP